MGPRATNEKVTRQCQLNCPSLSDRQTDPIWSDGQPHWHHRDKEQNKLVSDTPRPVVLSLCLGDVFFPLVLNCVGLYLFLCNPWFAVLFHNTFRLEPPAVV